MMSEKRLAAQQYIIGTLIYQGEKDFYFASSNGVSEFCKHGYDAPIFVADTTDSVKTRWEAWRQTTPNDDCDIVISPF